MQLDYYLIDAFTEQKFEGAQIAVFPQAENLNTEKMQLIAREMNLTESVFILPATKSEALACFKIFTPEQEIIQTGHTIIAAVFAMQKHSSIEKPLFKIELGERLLSIETNQTDKLFKIAYLCAEEIRMDSYVPSTKELAELIGLNEKDIEQGHMPMLASCIDNYLLIAVKNEALLRKASFNANKWTMSFVASLANKIFLFSENKNNPTVDFYGRLLGLGIGLEDDPPVAPAAPAFGDYLMRDEAEGSRSIVLQRGGHNKRKSLIGIQLDKKTNQPICIKVAGSAVLIAQGKIML